MEAFIRAMNLGIDRFAPPIPPEVAPERRALVAELGFALFRNQAQTGTRNAQEAIERVRGFIAGLSGEPGVLVDQPDDTEQLQASKLADKLFDFVTDRGGVFKLTIDPNIPGCGIVDRAAADFMIHRRLGQFAEGGTEEHHLFEVKAVDRSFRAEDVRQILTYAALLSAAGEAPERVGLVNPRLGTFGEWTPDELAQDVAGVSGSELLHQIIFNISEAEVSP